MCYAGGERGFGVVIRFLYRLIWLFTGDCHHHCYRGHFGLHPEAGCPVHDVGRKG